jgi:hypothetical protein
VRRGLPDLVDLTAASTSPYHFGMDTQQALIVLYLAIGALIAEIGFRRRGELRHKGFAYAVLVYGIATTIWLPIFILMALFQRSAPDAPQDAGPPNRPEGRESEGPPRR